MARRLVVNTFPMVGKIHREWDGIGINPAYKKAGIERMNDYLKEVVGAEKITNIRHLKDEKIAYIELVEGTSNMDAVVLSERLTRKGLSTYQQIV